MIKYDDPYLTSCLKQEYDMLSCLDGTIDQERRMRGKYNSAYSMNKTFLLHGMFSRNHVLICMIYICLCYDAYAMIKLCYEAYVMMLCYEVML